MDDIEPSTAKDSTSPGCEREDDPLVARKPPARCPSGEPLAHAGFDAVTEWLLYAMVVFAPWAFGTTQPWAREVMDVAGNTLGGLLAAKWCVRWGTGWKPRMGWETRNAEPEERNAGRRWPVRLQAALTVLMLAYCLTSAVNARATYLAADSRFEYHPCILWLPHSYDATSTWRAFADYLALATLFWATRDWLLGGGRESEAEGAGGRGGQEEDERRDWRRGVRPPPRLRRLLWVISVNGALLALEGIVQRSLGTNKLLWLVEPFYIKDPEAQFGPYAYRSNAAQYLGLVWPLALGFWWLLRHGTHQRRARATANLLLPCTLLAAVTPLISLSRAGAGVTCGAGVVAVVILLSARRRGGWKPRLGLAAFLALILLLGWYVGWNVLSERFKTTESDYNATRLLALRTSMRMTRDFPVFGTGPGTFMVMYGLYRSSPDQDWEAYLHNDWLETVITFGWAGFAVILLMLALAISVWFFGSDGIPAHRVPVRFLWLSLAGCLVYAIVDFPFQVYSVLSLFLVICAVLSSLTRKRVT